MVRQQLFIGAALIAGVAIGYFVQPEPDKVPAPVTVDELSSGKMIADRGEDALRARIRELEARLAKAQEDDEALVSNAVARIEVARKAQDRRPERAWLEELKEKDPARFAQMTNNFARWRQSRREQQAERASFLASVDTSRMSHGARKTHEAYQDLLERREALEEQLNDPNLEEETRRQLMSEMHAVSREIHQSSAAERGVLLGEVARAIGLEGDAAEELSQTVGEVLEVTGGARNGFPMPPPPHR